MESYDISVDQIPVQFAYYVYYLRVLVTFLINPYISGNKVGVLFNKGPDGSGEDDNSHRTSFGDPSTGVVCAAGPDGTGDCDRPPSSRPDSPGDPGEEDNSHRTRFAGPITGVVCTSGPDGTGDGGRLPSSEPDSSGGPGEEDNSPRTGLAELMIGVICTSGPDGPCDEDSSPPTGSYTPLHQFVCVYQPRSSGPGNEIGDVYERAHANAPGDVIEDRRQKTEYLFSKFHK